MFRLLKNLVRKIKYWKGLLPSKIKWVYINTIYSRPDAVIGFGQSLGDDLLCTIVARQLKEKGYKRIWMKTHYPELFANNPDFSKVIKKKEFFLASPEIERFLSPVEQISPVYTSYNSNTDRDIIPGKHIVHIMCDLAQVSYPSIIKPHLFLTQAEKKAGKLYNNQVCIQSTGRSSKHFMKNKEWYPERFAQVAEVLSSQYTIIQLGAASDELLPDVVDMRGKTSIRESAAILYNSKFFIGLVGFLMHLSRAVDCKGIIVFGGRESPEQSGYDFNLNLYSPVHCSPCWLWNTCNYNRMCMQNIKSSDVLESITRLAHEMEDRNEGRKI